MKYQVLLTERIAPVGISMLEKKAHIVVAPSPGEADLLSLVDSADALIIRSTKLTIPVMEAGKNLKIIGRHGAGLDNIDLPAATRLGLPVVYTPEANSNAVAEHTIWAILHFAKGLSRAEKALREGKFAREGSLPGLVHKLGFMTTELQSKKLALIGFGRVARRVAEIARCFRMEVKAYDPLVDDDAFQALSVSRAGTVEEAIQDADFVSLHVPYMKETHHLIGEKQLNNMKAASFLLNTSRGGVVDEEALYRALEDKKIAGAALDVYEKEPPATDHPFLGLENTIATPHMAAMTDRSLTNVAVDVCKGVLDALEGEKPKFIANPTVWENRRGSSQQDRS